MTDFLAYNLAEQLRRIAGPEPEWPRWHVDSTNTDNYCRDCMAPTPESAIAGGYDNGPSDGCVHCDDCGCVLNYILTDTGAECELHHFETALKELPQTFESGLTPETAFHLLRMVESAPEETRVLEVVGQILALSTERNSPAGHGGVETEVPRMLSNPALRPIGRV